MDRHKATFMKLTEVTEEEWLIAMAKCKKVIDRRASGRTRYGAHSEQRLGMSPFDYYFKGAIDKLYDGVWEWQFEKFTLAEQLYRMIDSMISEEVRKFKVEQEKEDGIVIQSLDEVEFFLAEENGTEEREKIYQEQLNIIEQSIQGDEEAEFLFILLQEGKNNNEICQEMGWDKKKLYKISERMRTKAKTSARNYTI